MVPAVSRMLARAFMTNPLHVAAFGDGQLPRNEAFFRGGLAAMKGPIWVARENDDVLGAIHWVQSPACQFSAVEKLTMMPVMIGSLGVRSSMRLATWMSVWSAHDPKEPHVHLGPIGVDPSAQRKHVGQRLMERYCAELDAHGQAGYLETDRPGNVTFYTRFGFEVTSEAPVLGVRNYFMWRPAKD
jgi:ribosomal protein S18 acetylase RimI-like enzyme